MRGRPVGEDKSAAGVEMLRGHKARLKDGYAYTVAAWMIGHYKRCEKMMRSLKDHNPDLSDPAVVGQYSYWQQRGTLLAELLMTVYLPFQREGWLDACMEVDKLKQMADCNDQSPEPAPPAEEPYFPGDAA